MNVLPPTFCVSVTYTDKISNDSTFSDYLSALDNKEMNKMERKRERGREREREGWGGGVGVFGTLFKAKSF